MIMTLVPPTATACLTNQSFHRRQARKRREANLPEDASAGTAVTSVDFIAGMIRTIYDIYVTGQLVLRIALTG